MAHSPQNAVYLSEAYQRGLNAFSEPFFVISSVRTSLYLDEKFCDMKGNMRPSGEVPYIVISSFFSVNIVISPFFFVKYRDIVVFFDQYRPPVS